MNLLERQMWPYLSPVWSSSVILRIKSKLLTKGNKDGHNLALWASSTSHHWSFVQQAPWSYLGLSLCRAFSHAGISFFSFFAGLSTIIQDSAYLSLIPESLPEPVCSSLLPQLPGVPWSKNLSFACMEVTIQKPSLYL